MLSLNKFSAIDFLPEYIIASLVGYEISSSPILPGRSETYRYYIFNLNEIYDLYCDLMLQLNLQGTNQRIAKQVNSYQHYKEELLNAIIAQRQTIDNKKILPLTLEKYKSISQHLQTALHKIFQEFIAAYRELAEQAGLDLSAAPLACNLAAESRPAGEHAQMINMNYLSGKTSMHDYAASWGITTSQLELQHHESKSQAKRNLTSALRNNPNIWIDELLAPEREFVTDTLQRFCTFARMTHRGELADKYVYNLAHQTLDYVHKTRSVQAAAHVGIELMQTVRPLCESALESNKNISTRLQVAEQRLHDKFVAPTGVYPSLRESGCYELLTPGYKASLAAPISCPEQSEPLLVVKPAPVMAMMKF